MADHDAPTRSTHQSRSPIRVLLIDDDPGFIAAAQTALAMPPDLSCVGVAHSPANARRLLGELAPDVALVDMGLAGNPLAGVELIAHMREVHPTCEPLAVTVFDDVSTVLAAIQAGASGYVLKGGSAEELCAQIRVVRYGGSPVSPPIARLLLKHLSAGVVHAGGVPGPADAPALSTNELQMLRLAAKGCSHDEIAQAMEVSRNTVLTYAKRCYRKLQVHSRTEAIYEARRMGLLPD